MILQKFAGRADDLMAGLERAVASANMPELAAQAHTLKGVAANLSAEALRARAAELERAAKCSIEEAANVVEAVRAETGRCLAAMPELLRSLGK